jgi:hypothetical protein
MEEIIESVQNKLALIGKEEQKLFIPVIVINSLKNSSNF